MPSEYVQKPQASAVVLAMIWVQVPFVFAEPAAVTVTRLLVVPSNPRGHVGGSQSPGIYAPDTVAVQRPDAVISTVYVEPSEMVMFAPAPASM
jgi:hypothetical protein